MATSKNGKHTKVKLKTQRELLADIIKDQGSAAAVAKTLRCSQQSVSAWAHGTNVPRAAMQKKLLETYSIPQPWKRLRATA